MLVEPFPCNREEDAISIRKPVWKSMTVFLVRFVRNRQYLWVSAVGGDPEKSRIPAGGHNNRIIWAPVSPKKLRLIANRRRHTPSMETFMSLPSAQKPTQRSSRDRNGAIALSVPVMGFPSK